MAQKKVALGVLLGGLIVCRGGLAQDTTSNSTAIEQLRQQLDQQREELQRQERSLAAQEAKLDAQRRKLEQAQKRLNQLAGHQAAPATKPATGERRVAQAPTEQPVGQAPSRKEENRPPEVAPIFEQPGVLTPRGKWVLEPSLQYSYSSTNRVALIGYTIIPAITIGVIDVRKVNSATLVGALTTRYGITNRLEFELKIPYVYRNDDSVTRPFNQGTAQDTVFNAKGHGLGDIELALRYQFNNGGYNRPYYVGSLRLKTRTGKDPFDVRYSQASSAATGMLQEELPTGSGFYGIQPGLTVIYPSDPAVFFGGVNYLWNIKRNVDKTVAGTYIGTVDPGDAFGFNMGMGLALNDRASFSIGYEHTVIGKTRFDGEPAPGATSSQLGTLLLGYAYRYSPTTSYNLTVGAGLTQDTPDVQITLRAPVTF